MSDYGVFEATSTDGHEEEQRQRQARRDLGTAIEAAREGFGDFLGSSTDKQDYQDRLALVMNDLMQKVADSGVMPVPGVMRKVKAALRPEFRKQAYFDPNISDENLLAGLQIAEALNHDGSNQAKVDELRAEVDARGLTPLKASRKHTAETPWYKRWDRTEDEILDELYDMEGVRDDAVRNGFDSTSAENRIQELREELNYTKRNSSHKKAIAPHPEYGEGVWSDEGVKQRVLSLNPNLPVPELVDAIMREMGDLYDSIDRELAFWYFSQVTGKDYDDFYNAWLNLPSGKYFSRRKQAFNWKDTDFNSWVKMDGGAWSLEVEEVGGDFWVSFNGGPADGQMEQLSASSMEEAKAEAESIASSKGITASRKQAAEYDPRIVALSDEELERLLKENPDHEGLQDEAYTRGLDKVDYFAKRKQAAAPWETFYTTDIRLDGSESETYTAQLGNGVTLEAFEDPYSPGGWGWSVWLKGDDGIKRYQVGGGASSPDEAKKAAEAASQERKQAGSAQVLQKLENALNDQRSVDVICSNSPDGSFSSEREIPVDEGLQKVRGWISAGDLVDTAQGGGNFFDFEHRASGENVNFYITQEY